MMRKVVIAREVEMPQCKFVYFNKRGVATMPDCRLVLRTAGGKEFIQRRNPAARKESFQATLPERRGRRGERDRNECQTVFSLPMMMTARLETSWLPV